MIVLPDAENRTIVSSFVWTKHRNVTDRLRQTDRIGLAITAVRIASNADRCKNDRMMTVRFRAQKHR